LPQSSPVVGDTAILQQQSFDILVGIPFPFVSLADTHLLGKIPAGAHAQLQDCHDLRERASGREKFFISTFFYSIATEELDKANQELQLWIEEYPRDQNYPHLMLGNNYISVGQFEKAAAEYRLHLDVDPESAIGYGNLANVYRSLDRLDEAKATIDAAMAHTLD
jgi:tetratricopeptide (TPR) repeat protein